MNTPKDKNKIYFLTEEISETDTSGINMSEDKNKIYFSIKEVSEKTGEAESTLRFWEAEFKTVISPKRNDGGTRFYTEKDIEDVKLVKSLLRDRKFTIEGAREILKDKDKKEDAQRQAILLEHLQHIEDELKIMSELLNSC